MMTSFQPRRINPIFLTSLPPLAWGSFVIFFILVLFSPNPGIGLLGVIFIIGLSLMLWRPAEPQILLFLVGFQWLQSFSPVLLALYEGQTIATVMGGEEFETATILTLLGVAVFALGLKVGTRPITTFELALFCEGIKQLNWRRLFIIWMMFCIARGGLTPLQTMFPGLQQGIVSFTICKWGIIFLLFLYWLISKKGGFAAIVVLISESIIGFMGYFSDFREVFFILLLAATGKWSLCKRGMGVLILVGSLLLIVFGFWQSMKSNYRNFLSQGEAAQVVHVSISDRIGWLARAICEVEGKAISKGWEEGLRRLCYVEFFGYSLREVPYKIPHTRGKLWKEALLHPLTPRLFFPKKSVINDSDRTNSYARIVPTADEGTSIGIGYIGESYIDFGYWGMFLPIFCWGWLVSRCFDTLWRKAPHPLLGMAFASCLLLSTVLWLENSNIKMMGALIAGFLVNLVLMHFFGKKMWVWLTRSKHNRNISRFGSSPTILSYPIESKII